MKTVLFLLRTLAGPAGRLPLLLALFGGYALAEPDDWNVNSRYTVERIELPGIDQDRLSRSLRSEIKQRIGQKFNPTAFAQLAGRVRDEIGARFVKSKLERGSAADQVRVVFEVTGRRLPREVAPPSSFSWHGLLGWSGNMTSNIGNFYAGIQSEQQQSTERYAGLYGGYSGTLWKDRIRPSLRVTSLHSQYSPQTLAAAQAAGNPLAGNQAAGSPAAAGQLYHNHLSLQPEVTVIPWRGFDREELQVTTGFRSQRFVPMSPGIDRSFSQALVNTLRYQRLRGQDQGDGLRNAAITASYTLTAGLTGLGSDFDFRKQEVAVETEVRVPNKVVLRLTGRGGALQGNAPLWDRFAYGSTQVMRGWSNLRLAPLGAERAVATGLEAGRSLGKGSGQVVATAFYDVGAVWNREQAVVARHSLGGGFRTRGGFFLYLAFPIRSYGGVEPVLMTGATF